MRGYVNPAGLTHSMGVSFEAVKNNLFKLVYIGVRKNEFIPKEVDELNYSKLEAKQTMEKDPRLERAMDSRSAGHRFDSCCYR
jgi:hypothetical protein